MKVVLDFLLYAGHVPCPKCKQPVNMYARVLWRGEAECPGIEQKRAGICNNSTCNKPYIEALLEGAL